MSTHRSDHRAPRRRSTGRVRALVALAAVAVLATGMSVRGTFAFWTDTATLKTGDFASGTLDITLDDRLAGPGTVNNPGTYANTSFALTAMLPGESVALSFPIKNIGTTPLTYTVAGTGTGNLAVADGMRYSVTFGASQNNTGTAANGDRTGTCNGNPPTDASTQVLGSTSTPLANGAVRTLQPTGLDQVCILARLSSTAGNTLQNQSGSASITFSAKQIGAP